MKSTKIATAVSLAMLASSAFAGGPLYIHDKTMQPYKWDTTKGAIPVYTDGGPVVPTKDGGTAQAFTIDYDGTAFLTIEQANKVTADAVAEWTNVATSTFAMTVQGTIAEKTGIADVNETNVDQIYNAENGYGFWVNYDTDGQILEQYFGIPRNQVLGIAFPEWANEETGEITEATALMNGWFVDVSDTEGKQVGGVFTHEFGHAINMSHSQANGQLTYMSAAYSPQYDGVPGCAGVNTYTSASQIAPDTIETMFPFINVRGAQGANQHTVNIKDDIVNISDLYPTPDYKTSYGSISGTLYTKEGIEYSGVNMVARNLDNPLYDVITQQSGNLTQGKVGPDGKFVINGLTPGGRYVLYTESIKAGGYPTRQTAIVSEAEYWNEGESANPALDDACAVTPIVVAGGETKEVSLYFNGYTDGIQYTPLVQAFVMDHAKNGKQAMGITGSVPFLYDSTKKAVFQLHPAGPAVKAGTAAMNKNATKATVMADFTGNGIGEAAIWDLSSNKLTPIGDLNGNTCGGGGTSGTNASYPWDMDDTGNTVVGTAYRDMDGNGNCQTSGKHEVVPFKWTKKQGMVQLPYDLPGTVQWVRADRVSGNGETITGTNSGYKQVAWVNGQFVDTYSRFGARDISVMSADGKRIGFGSAQGLKIWDTTTDTVTELGTLRWCEQVPFNHFFLGNLCAQGYTHETLVPLVGLPPMVALDATEDLSMISVRAGGLFSGIVGGLYIDGMGWINLKQFFGKQGVVEASQSTMDNPFGLSANGSEMMGGLAGATISFAVDQNKAFVCDNGTDRELSFPKQVVQAVQAGAEFGRCAHIND
ncbi:hypothetical protein [Shewanella sp. FJAT-52076]|uniref:hypothetical protein n=1 Tax=Shewanella sp. FJAT-52076 TaxID=2864202 RepID=UPI001C6610B5|nr:hypothetical protein [Shewanella sp. FJAT-52076]QYJ77031.1 hypothetical protein K0H79_08845 [Shewanella sp. FJAT-52076]